jgi:L-lactate dehydrogenase complex protein LldE
VQKNKILMETMQSYPEKPDTVYYFGTCLADMFYPDAGMSGIRLLQHAGVRVIFPIGQTCCGQPAYNSGFPDEARAVAKKQISLFPKPVPVIVPSGSCAGMMRFHYPKLFAYDPALPDILKFSERVFELSGFLVHALNIKLEDKGAPFKVTWHSSCHATREMKVTEDSKSLIRQLKNVELVELENEYECCGFGGTFSVKHPAISSVMVRDKVSDIRKTGASRVVTGECGCLMNISGSMEYDHVPVQGQHLADFLWERINGA